MTVASPNVFQALIQQPRSVLEYGADLDRQDLVRSELQQRKRQNALQDMAAQQQIKKQNALQRAATGWGAGTTDEQRIESLRRDPLTFDAADALEASTLKRSETRSKVAKDEAEAEKIKLASEYMRRDRHLQSLASVTDPQSAAAWIGQGVQTGEFSMDQAQRIIAGLQSGQIPLEQWKQRAQQGGMTLQQQAQQRMEELKAVETQRHNQATEGISVENNKRTVGASLANAAATREAGKLQADATRSAANTKRDQDTEMKLADDYRTQSKGFKEAKDAYAQLSATLGSAATSPAATLAAATKFMKILDPGSVVRESELGMALAASGVIDRALNYISTLQSGQKLTPAQVADFKKTSQQIYEAAQSVQRDIDKDYQTKAKTYGLRPEMVTQDLGQNAKVVSWGDLK